MPMVEASLLEVMSVRSMVFELSGLRQLRRDAAKAVMEFRAEMRSSGCFTPRERAQYLRSYLCRGLASDCLPRLTYRAMRRRVLDLLEDAREDPEYGDGYRAAAQAMLRLARFVKACESDGVKPADLLDKLGV